MVKYLQLNGTSDYIQCPSLQFDEIIIDVVRRNKTSSVNYYFDTRVGLGFYLYHSTTNIDYYPNINGSKIYVDGVLAPVASGQAYTTADVRQTIRATLTTAGTDNITFFTNNTGAAANTMPADVYSIKLLLGGVVKAFYDMSTGTVQDQSGNGYHATLTGGTWLDDGTGGSTGTTYTGEGTAQGYSTLSSLEQAIIKALGTAQGYSTLSSGEILITFIGNTYEASGTIQGYSSLSSSEKAVFEALGTAYGYSANQVHEIVTLLASGIAEGYSNVILIEKKEIIAQVTLTGWQRLEARLVGRQNKDVQLQGKQVANAQLKGVMK